MRCTDSKRLISIYLFDHFEVWHLNSPFSSTLSVSEINAWRVEKCGLFKETANYEECVRRAVDPPKRKV